MKKSIFFDYLILLILIWLPIYQDSHLYNLLGSYGHAPVAIFSLFSLLYCIMTKKNIKNQYVKKFLNLILLNFSISIISFVIYYLSTNSILFYGENLFIKIFKGQLYFISIFSYIWSFISISRRFDKMTILKQFKNVFIFLFVIMIIEYFNLPSAFSFIHAIRPYNYYRIRLLTSESSWTTAIILVYYCLAMGYAFNKKSTKKKIVYSFLLIIFIALTSSKSLMLCILMWFVIFMISNELTYNKIFLLIVISVVGMFFTNTYIEKLANLFKYDLENSTSISTRIYSIVCGLLLIIKNPIGYGTSIYLPFLVNQFNNSFIKFSRYSWFNYTEISNIIKSGTDSSLAIKSGILQYTLYWGVPGTIYFFSIFINLLHDLKMKVNSKETQLYRSCLLIIIIYISFVSAFDYKYEIWSFVSYIIFLIYNKKEEENL